jgi:uncharacterized membrane protein YkoI
VPGGVVISVERETRQGKTVWEVVVHGSDKRGVELDIDAQTGDILKRKPETLSAYERDAVLSVGISAAITKALSVTPGTVHEAELERLKDGRLVWEIEIITSGGRQAEVYIDVATGDVVG